MGGTAIYNRCQKNLALLIYRAVCTRSVNLKYTEVNLKALEGILTPGSFEIFFVTDVSQSSFKSQKFNFRASKQF